MATKSAVMDFVGQRSLAVVGVSRGGKKFGNTAYRELKAKGYQLVPVHPQAETLEGDRCVKNPASLPASVGGVLVIVPPQQAEQVVQEAAAAGIKHVWLQQGAESQAAIRLAESKGMSVIAGECILMFAEPAGFGHRAHRWIKGLFGGLPK
ncbi:MAG: CoA-binding protein [Chloroflexi bacterium]|nr:CoA-binding protein [Chloroflexota bacterium]